MSMISARLRPIKSCAQIIITFVYWRYAMLSQGLIISMSVQGLTLSCEVYVCDCNHVLWYPKSYVDLHLNVGILNTWCLVLWYKYRCYTEADMTWPSTVIDCLTLHKKIHRNKNVGRYEKMYHINYWWNMN